MRFLTAFALSALLVFHPAIAKKHTPVTQEDNELIEQGNYTNSDGKQIHKPAHTKSGNAPNGATAKCRDDSYSFSTHHRGTCSRHGGVSEWLS
ncbi:DUF3761 domain-containing protein [Pantoea ananatis]|uniref:DUF3761 domain-containing protein n=1 Tax=Pantoea ananas TaxID=553 RepID=UPI001FF471BF|nr:DUF3761 domain-containing protein [Pantoea ananatis]MCK0552615.1 DUF3761 domain-containing protein [Pantoea ananatis]